MFSSEPSPLRVMLVDDQGLIRAALRDLLAEQPGLDVVGDAPDARTAIDLAGDLHPDVILLDITMPGLSGIDAIAPLLERSPTSKIVMLTQQEGAAFIRTSLEQGAAGYVSKSSKTAELLDGLDAVSRGETYVAPSLSRHVAIDSPSRRQGRPARRDPLERLTNRERQTLQLLALGRCNKEVARELGIALGTAKKHRENLQRKLDCHSSAGLARLAIREGLLCA